MNDIMPNEVLVGASCFWGNYPQTASGEEAPIEWTVLAIEAGKALMISRYVIDCMSYNDNNTDTEWMNSSARRWLNETFIAKAFSPEETSMISETTVEVLNQDDPADPAVSAIDRIFLLSPKEADYYFKNNGSRACHPTEYAVSKGAYMPNDNCWWWLRSSGEDPYSVPAVSYDGSVNTYGLNGSGSDIGMRPAFWMHLDMLYAIKHPETEMIRFGRYRQGPGGDVRDIDWQVLKEEGGKKLVISRHVLDCQPYNIEGVSVTWERCTLRKWLNTYFMSTAFNAKEAEKIFYTEIAAEKNPQHDTDPGNGTMDRIFLLSIEEAQTYFKSDDLRTCCPTENVKHQGISVGDGGRCWWWLRSPGDDSLSAAIVSDEGSVMFDGIMVGSIYRGVRPALWIDPTIAETENDDIHV